VSFRAVDPAEPARALLWAGVPLTLLLDIAAGPALDSRSILAAEEAQRLAEWARDSAAGARPVAGPRLPTAAGNDT
jgi:hypothetical protein